MAVLEDRLVEVIKSKSTEVAQKWYHEVLESQYIPNLRGQSEEQGMTIAMTVYDNLCNWLTPSGSKDIKDIYMAFGRTLYYKGFEMEEVVQTLVLLKRYLWLALLEMGLMTTDLNIYQTLELNNKVVLYYDRAIYFAIVGYKDARSANR